MKEKMNSQQPKVIISGGGTGGHIFPAIAIADCLKKRYPQAEILFIGAKNRMEMDRVPKAGYPIEGLWISGFKRELSLDNLSFPFKLISSMINARKILKRFKPDVVIGVGGFASGPTMKTAASMHIPIVIQEQNSYPGITNKIITLRTSSRSFSKKTTTSDGNLRLYFLEVFCICCHCEFFFSFFTFAKFFSKTFYTVHPYTCPTFIFRQIHHYYYIDTHHKNAYGKKCEEIFNIDSSYEQKHHATGE